MATQTVQFTADPSLTLTVDVAVDSSGASFATGSTVTIASDGRATFTLTSSSGVYRIAAKSGATVVGTLFVRTTDTAATFDAVKERASIARADTLADVLADTNELQTNQGDWATADVSLLALEATAQAILTDTGVLPASFPTNFAALGINSDGHVSRVTLVDTTTTNTDMRGTDGALTELPSIPAGWITGTGLDSTAIVAMGSYQIPQTVPAVGTAPTRDQALGMLVARGTKSAIVGTTETIYAADGTTPLYTLTLTNSGEYTTAIARAS